MRKSLSFFQNIHIVYSWLGGDQDVCVCVCVAVYNDITGGAEWGRMVEEMEQDTS